jgi:hypothetical protein
MALSDTNEPDNLNETKLLRRDWILLPLLSLLTMSSLVFFTEVVSRRVFLSVETILPTCLVFDDQSTGVRARPNTSCIYKRPEYPIEEYRFNSAGYRAGMESEPKPAGTFRIVMMGSSYSLGLGVTREESFAALLPGRLSQETGRNIELYNEGMYFGTPHRDSLSFNDVLAAKPDMILWPLTPWDLENVSDLGTTDPMVQNAADNKIAFTRKLKLRAATAVSQLDTKLHGTALLVRHFMYESQSQYLKSYLLSGDDQSGFLKSEPSALWQSRLRQFDVYFADVTDRARAAGVPFVVVLVPDRAEAAMISMGEWPAGYDPYKFGDELRAITQAHGATFIDILTDFRNLPNPEKHYLPVDNHPDVTGNAIIARIIAQELTAGAIPALTPASKPRAEMEQPY